MPVAKAVIIYYLNMNIINSPISFDSEQFFCTWMDCSLKIRVYKLILDNGRTLLIFDLDNY